MIGWKRSSEPDDWATFVSGENPTTRRVLPLVNCFAAVMLAVPRHSCSLFPDIPLDHFQVADDSFRMQN